MIIELILSQASSVDAERAFSCGRLQVNHLQHNMSSQTFKAQMAVGSWSGTPLMPDDVPSSIIADAMSRDGKSSKVKGKGKERARDIIEVTDSD